MNCIQSLSVLIFMLGFILSSAENNFLRNICFQFGSCRSNDTYLKLTPSNFESNVYNYTIHIPNNYPFYTPIGPMNVEFYVFMTVSNTDDFNYQKQSVAKSVLYDAGGKQVLTSSELAYSSNEMLLISAELSFGMENEITTKLIVYQFEDNIIQQSDPYILTFKRNE